MIDITPIIRELQRRGLHLLIALDQMIYVLITLGHAQPDETISAGLWRMEQQGKWQGLLLRPVVDWLLRPFGKNHCFEAYLAELERQQLEPIYRRKDIHD